MFYRIGCNFELKEAFCQLESQVRNWIHVFIYPPYKSTSRYSISEDLYNSIFKVPFCISEFSLKYFYRSAWVAFWCQKKNTFRNILLKCIFSYHSILNWICITSTTECCLLTALFLFHELVSDLKNAGSRAFIIKTLLHKHISFEVFILRD